jgi:hypothetical protein
MLRAYEHTKAIGIFAPGLLLSKSPTTYSQIDTACFVDGIYSHKPPMKLFRDSLLDLVLSFDRHSKRYSSGG